MTREYELADKMKSKFYVRTAAENSVTKSRASGERRKRKRMTARRETVREVTSRSAIHNKTMDSAVTPDAAVKVKKKILSPVFVAILLIATMMMLFLVMSFSEVYEAANDVAGLEKQLEALRNEEEELTLKLEEKNDMRKIETIAINKLGMVKEDSLQKKFVSLSEGERIDIHNAEENPAEKGGAVMLSSVLSALGDFFDRFR